MTPPYFGFVEVPFRDLLEVRVRNVLLRRSQLSLSCWNLPNLSTAILSVGMMGVGGYMFKFGVLRVVGDLPEEPQGSRKMIKSRLDRSFVLVILLKGK